MIIYDTKRWVPTDINMLVIEDGDGGYYYIHRSLYDQAVVLDYLYHDNVNKLIEEITGQTETRDDVVYFLENTPRPLNIFGPFLLLVKELVADYVDMVGAIHVMSGPMNLCKMVEIPFAMRNNPTFSLSIRDEYILAWNRFFQTVIPYSEDMYIQGGAPMNGTATSTSGFDKPVEDMSKEEIDDAIWAILNDDSGYDTPTDPVTEDVAPTPEPVVTPEPAPAHEPAPEPKQDEFTAEKEIERVKEVNGLAAMLSDVI